MRSEWNWGWLVNKSLRCVWFKKRLVKLFFVAQVSGSRSGLLVTKYILSTLIPI